MPQEPGEVTPEFLYRPYRCLATDPIGMEFTIGEVDEDTRRQLEAVRFQTAGEVYKALAEGYFAAGKIYSSQ